MKFGIKCARRPSLPVLTTCNMQRRQQYISAAYTQARKAWCYRVLVSSTFIRTLSRVSKHNYNSLVERIFRIRHQFESWQHRCQIHWSEILIHTAQLSIIGVNNLSLITSVAPRIIMGSPRRHIFLQGLYNTTNFIRRIMKNNVP